MTRSVPSLALLFCLTALSAAPASFAANEPTPAKPAPKATPLSGKVLETMDGGGYTYILLGTGSDKKWAAVPLMKVAVGQKITLMPGFEMNDFSSKALNRKFDKVYFSGGVENQELGMSAEAIQKSHKGISAEKLNAAIKPEPAAAPAKGGDKPVKVGKVAKASGPNAYSVAELYAKKKTLEKKSVTIRGTVVKVSTGILKRNWIHLQDGSGSAKKKTNDVVVTSKEAPEMGSVVTAKGILYNNKDFGAGYKYDVIVEEAKISR